MVEITRKKLSSIVLSAIVISSILSLEIYTYATSPSTTPTFSSGPYPGAPTYTIYTNGSWYYAKNAYGAIDYSGTNASQIINSCIGNNTWIKILQQTTDPIWIDSPIIIPDNTLYCTFEGQDIVQSPQITGGLKLSDGANCDMFRVGQCCHQIHWFDLGMTGNKAGQTLNNSNGIHFVGTGCSSDCRIERCLIIDFTEHCIYIEKLLSASYILQNYLENSYGDSIHACGLINSIVSGNFLWSCHRGIYMNSTAYACQDNTISENKISHQRYGNISSAGAIIIFNSTGNDILGNWIDDSVVGISLDTTYRGIISHNDIRTCKTYGIKLRYCAYLSIENNLVIGASYDTNSGYDGIYISATGAGTHYCTFIGNLVSSTDFTNKVRMGINEEAGSDYNIYVSEYCTGAVTKNISVTGAHSHVASSYNGTSWIS